MHTSKLHAASKERGQSLFELVVAIAVSALIMVAIVTLAVNSIQNSVFSKNKALAATYAQQATEWLRGQRNSSIDTFMTNANDLTATDPVTHKVTWCLRGPKILTWDKRGACSSTDFITGTSFKRQVAFSADASAGKTIFETDVTVSWTDSKGVHEVVSITNLADLR